MSDQLVAEAATYTTHNKHKRRTYMPSEGFEPAIPAIERSQTNALDGTATGIRISVLTLQKTMSIPYKRRIHLEIVTLR
jgi:hypothetical protein